jgi:ribosomal protein S1
LVHLSELSWDPVHHPEDILAVGQEVKVKVINIDMERLRLALSIKQLENDPLLETIDTVMPVSVAVRFFAGVLSLWFGIRCARRE